MKISEYEEVKISDENQEGKHLTRLQIDELKKIYSKLVKNEIINRQLYEFTDNNTIKFFNYGGAIDLGSITIELTPKAFFDKYGDDKSSFLSLARMISYIFGEEMKSNEELLRIKEQGKAEVLQLVVYFYLIALRRSLRHGVFKTYEESSIDYRFVQGRILIEKQIVKIDQSKLSQEAFFHTSNTNLMRYFKTASIFFARILENHFMKEELHRFVSLLDDVEILTFPEIRNKIFVFNRLNENFRSPYLISKFILSGMSLSPSENKDTKGVAILFDMNVLFEKFVTELIKRNRMEIFPADTIYQVCPQSSDQKHLFLMHSTRSLRPDIRIENLSTVPKKVYIMDTKYKDFNNQGSETNPISKVEKEDLYQTYVYSQKYSSDATIIVYPGNETTSKFSDYFEIGNRFLLWEINLSLFDRDWEKKLVKEFKALFEDILTPIHN